MSKDKNKSRQYFVSDLQLLDDGTVNCYGRTGLRTLLTKDEAEKTLIDVMKGNPNRQLYLLKVEKCVIAKLVMQEVPVE